MSSQNVFANRALKLHTPAADLSDFVLRAAFSSDRESTPSRLELWRRVSFGSSFLLFNR